MAIDPKAKAVIADAVRRSADDPAFFCRFFFPHWFPSEMPAFHLGILALRTRKVDWLEDSVYADARPFLLEYFKYATDPQDPTSTQLPVFIEQHGQLVMVCDDYLNEIIPRGFSKTTLLNAANSHDILTDGKTFCVYISKSAEHAEMQLGNIKVELETNQLLRAAYGDLVPSRADPEKWQADQLQLLNGAILVARGKGGQVRGLNYRGRRPNKIILDDVEDDGLADSPTERKKTRKWFYSAVEKAGQVMEGAAKEEWAQQPLQITNLGTLLHPDALCLTLSKDPKFNTVRFGAKLSHDPDDHSMLWPYKMSYELYMKERRRHTIIGQLAEFTREIDSAIRVGDDTIFPDRFIYESADREDFAQVVVFCDPAISDSPDADDAAIVVAGRRLSDGVLFALEEWGGRGKSPREIVDKLFELHQKWQCTGCGIESQAYQKSLIFMMNEEMAVKRYWFVIQGVVRGSKENKERRILGLLSPRYMNGRIRHLRPLSGLESNIADWPNGKKDYADAFASALTMLGESGAMVIPVEEREDGDYAPLQTVLPPAYATVSNHIIRGSAIQRNASRYPAGGLNNGN